MGTETEDTSPQTRKRIHSHLSHPPSLGENEPKINSDAESSGPFPTHSMVSTDSFAVGSWKCGNGFPIFSGYEVAKTAGLKPRPGILGAGSRDSPEGGLGAWRKIRNSSVLPALCDKGEVGLCLLPPPPAPPPNFWEPADLPCPPSLSPLGALPAGDPLPEMLPSLPEAARLRHIQKHRKLNEH